MGMILTKYGMLHSLGYNANNAVSKETKYILDPYKLFGIVIHDPKEHPGFDACLEGLFEKLDYVTGRDFLFFCLLNPNKEWLDRTKRDYFDIWKPEELLSLRNPGNKNSSVSAYTLAQSLGIEYDDLPAIVLTNNFQLNQYHVVKTCETQLEKQMTEIGYFCSQKDKYFSLVDDPDFLSLLESINLCDGTSYISAENSIARIISDFLAFDGKLSQQDRNIARRQRIEVVSQFISRKEFIRDPKRFDQLCMSFLGLLSNLHSKTEAHFEDPFPEGGESESKRILATYQRVYLSYDSLRNKFDQEIQRKYRPRRHMELDPEAIQLDYAPLVLSLCKVFEIEVNLSIVHWIRKSLNIEMPDYFKKRKNDHNDYSIQPLEEVIKNPRPVDFNGGYGKKWIAPGIGQSELVAKSLVHKPEFKDLLNFDLLFPEWERIRIIRNKAAHTEPISKDQYEDVKSAFDRIMKSSLFQEMIRIKSQLKNQD